MEVLFPGSTGVRRRFPVHFHELTDRQPLRFDLGPAGLVVVPIAVVHASGAPALALRVAWQGHTIAYTGDTEWTEALVELARGADLLIAEGYTHQRRIRFHLDVASLQRHAGRLAARRVILTHLSADVLARADELGWETASDGGQPSRVQRRVHVTSPWVAWQSDRFGGETYGRCCWVVGAV